MRIGMAWTGAGQLGCRRRHRRGARGGPVRRCRLHRHRRRVGPPPPDRPPPRPVPPRRPDRPAHPDRRATRRPAQVPDVLRFTGTTLDGAAFDAAQLAGKPVVLWFWAPWCATCASQAWTVAEIAPRYRDTVPIVGVAGLGERKAMKEFVTEFDLGGTPQIDDSRGALWKRFKVTEQSIFVIIDRNGDGRPPGLPGR